jgi:hypothetical protein
MRRTLISIAAFALAVAMAGPKTSSPGLRSLSRIDLPNGLRVLLGEPGRTPLFSEVLLLVGAGTDAPHGGENARIAAEILMSGRLSPPGPPILVQLARLGVTTDSTVGRDVTVFRFAIPRQSTAPFMRLLAAMVGRQAPDEETWSDAVERAHARFDSEQADPWTRAVAELLRRNWRFDSAAPDSAPPAFADFLRRFYGAGNMVLAVASDAAVTEAEIRSDFGSLPARPRMTTETHVDPTPRHGSSIQCMADRTAVPPALLIAMPAGVENDRAFYAWQIAAHILGASYNSRLQKKLRTDAQLVYTVEAAAVPVGSRGMTLRVACQTEQIEHARKVILDELERLTRETVAAEELDFARSLLHSRLKLDAGSVRNGMYSRALAILSLERIRDMTSAEPILAAFTPDSLLRVLSASAMPKDAATIVVSARSEAFCEATHEVNAQ